MKILAAISIVLMGLIVSAVQTRVGDDVRISTHVDGDLYIAGGTVTIDAPVRGDVVAAGGTIIINDSVTMDVIVAGGEVDIKGVVGDDVRAAGGKIRISGTVMGDVVLGSGEIHAEPSALIHGNLLCAGGELEIFGKTLGSVKVAGDEIDFRGSAGDELTARANEIVINGTIEGTSSIAAREIVVGPKAMFGNDVTYWNSDQSLDISAEAHKGEVSYDENLAIPQPRWQFLGFTSLLLALWYLGTALVVIWSIEYLFSKTMLRAAEMALSHSAKSIGYGALFFVGMPIVCVALAITVLAIPISIILLAGYIILIILATGITAIVISNWLNRVYYKSSWTVVQVTMAAFGIFIVLKLVTLTPGIGPAIMILSAFMAFGAIILSLRRPKETKPT